MGRIIFSIVSLVALAVIIVMNSGSVAAFNLFGWQLDGLPVTVIAIVSFVIGVLYSFIFYVASYFARTRKAKLASRNKDLKERERQVKAVESEAASERAALALADGSEGARRTGFLSRILPRKSTGEKKPS